jgi:hypothetical protein
VAWYKRREGPLIVTLIVALFIIFEYFFGEGGLIPEATVVSGEIQTFVVFILAFVIGVGVLNVMRIHWHRIQRRKPGDYSWIYSSWIFVVIILFIITGVFLGAYSGLRTAEPSYVWMFDYVYMSLGGTMYSLLAFFIASGAYRAFRARTAEAALLLIAGTLVMLGNAPIGGVVWSGFIDINTWIQGIPMMAGIRGILIGAGLGAIAMGIRILTGRERGYLGGGE